MILTKQNNYYYNKIKTYIFNKILSIIIIIYFLIIFIIYDYKNLIYDNNPIVKLQL